MFKSEYDDTGVHFKFVEGINLGERKTIVKRAAVVDSKMNKRCGNDRGGG